MQIRNLSVQHYANGFTHWHYKARNDETIAEVEKPHYFDDAAALFALGDVITISNENWAAVRHVGGNDEGWILSPLI